MTTTAIPAEGGPHTAAHDHGEHHEPGFIGKYVFSTDHKMIAKQFMWVSLFFLLVGGTLAGIMRWQLGFPNEPIPLIGNLFPETMAPGRIPGVAPW